MNFELRKRYIDETRRCNLRDRQKPLNWEVLRGATTSTARPYLANKAILASPRLLMGLSACAGPCGSVLWCSLTVLLCASAASATLTFIQDDGNITKFETYTFPRTRTSINTSRSNRFATVVLPRAFSFFSLCFFWARREETVGPFSPFFSLARFSAYFSHPC
jgi:hypothetical protein